MSFSIEELHLKGSEFLLDNQIIGKCYLLFRVAIKLGLPGSGVDLIQYPMYWDVQKSNMRGCWILITESSNLSCHFCGSPGNSSSIPDTTDTVTATTTSSTTTIATTTIFVNTTTDANTTG